MRDPDPQIFDSFMFVVGILIGGAITLFFRVGMLAIDTQGHYVLEDPNVVAEINDRIAPLGQVELADNSEEAAAMQAAPSPRPKVVAAPLTGPQVYNAVCIACHAAPGVGGAPALGDGHAWAARIGQGMDTLIDHALHGFSGSTGVMPRKGGRVDLSDEEIIGAVEYMIEQVPQ
jgi:cytochrome c5